MASKSSILIVDLLVLCLILFQADFGGSDLAQDRAECANKLVRLSGCLTYVNGEAKTPTLDCCDGFKDVLEKSDKCICLLIKDRNDPNLGLTINATLAVMLPSICHVPANITKCIDLLHLAPNSKEAKEFKELAKMAEKDNSIPSMSTGSGNATVGAAPKSGGWDRRCTVAKVVWILPLLFIIHIFLLFS